MTWTKKTPEPQLTPSWAAIVMARIEVASDALLHATELLSAQAEAARLLAEQDRKQLALLIQFLTNAAAANVRMEAATAVVATDLEASHKRADATEGHPGEAADAASKSEPE